MLRIVSTCDTKPTCELIGNQFWNLTSYIGSITKTLEKNKIILQIRDVKYVFNIIFDYSNMSSKTMSYLLLF
jgi:hypothetical protein